MDRRAKHQKQKEDTALDSKDIIR